MIQRILRPRHRTTLLQAAAPELGIGIVPLPGDNPDLMPVEALWRRLREDVTCHQCHGTADDLARRVAAFEARISQASWALADRLHVKEQLDPDKETTPSK